MGCDCDGGHSGSNWPVIIVILILLFIFFGDENYSSCY